ncbi:DUF2628 domain-containing protein [Methylocystis iwaonis]|uniref:DUF2628 domain-containing protein n=1 Tax=Methylocystis iwaonis TaxID=2885079 RepID=UPI002E7B3CA3|nr:DUF2628 domain-containing protein [Methylocystis iwaonis]
MAIFTVHLPPEGAARPDKIVFLRDSFSTPAFIFGPLWLLWKRAWIAALGWSLLLAAISAFGVSFMLPKLATSFLALAAALVLGFEGDRILAWSLQRRGYVEGDLVNADSEEEAEMVYFGRLRAFSPETLPSESRA